MAAVELQGIFKRYGTTPVVKGLSLSIASGELVALLGPSGCGKTTTLRMIAGLERPDAGRLSIDGEAVDGPGLHVPPERRGLSMVFQSYAVFPHRSVFDNVAYPLELQRVPAPERKARVLEALAWVRLGGLEGRMPQALSGGQLQRVAIARALVARPKVLLLDEPLSNLDARLREELRGELAALRARLKTTMIFVTHDQAEALALADRVAVMNGGVVEQLDTPQALYQRPATPFVASFVGGATVLSGVAKDGHFHVAGVALLLPSTLAAEGEGTLVLRPEDVRVFQGGAPLPLSARLFVGSAAEYRFALGETVLRALGPPDAKGLPGDAVPVSLERALFFPSKLV